MSKIEIISDHVNVSPSEYVTKFSINRNFIKLVDNDILIENYISQLAYDRKIQSFINNKTYNSGEYVFYKVNPQSESLYLLSCAEAGNQKPTTIINSANEEVVVNSNQWKIVGIPAELSVNPTDVAHEYVLSNKNSFLNTHQHNIDLSAHPTKELGLSNSTVLFTSLENISEHRDTFYYPNIVKSLIPDNTIIGGFLRKWDNGLLEYDIIFRLGYFGENDEAGYNILSANNLRISNQYDNPLYFKYSDDYNIFSQGDDYYVFIDKTKQVNLNTNINTFYGQIKFPEEFKDLNYMCFSSSLKNVESEAKSVANIILQKEKYDSRLIINGLTITGTVTSCATDKEFIIPSEIKTIGNYGLAGLKEANNYPVQINFNIDAELINICNLAFYGSDIYNITIPKHVRCIGTYAFAECKNLKTVDFYVSKDISKQPILDIGIFDYCYSLSTINIHYSSDETLFGRWDSQNLENEDRWYIKTNNTDISVKLSDSSSQRLFFRGVTLSNITVIPIDEDLLKENNLVTNSLLNTSSTNTIDNLIIKENINENKLLFGSNNIINNNLSTNISTDIECSNYNQPQLIKNICLSEEDKNNLLIQLSNNIPLSIIFKSNSTLLNKVINSTQKLSKEYSISQRLDWIINNRVDFPKCQICNKSLSCLSSFINLNKGYRKYCSLSCANNAAILQAKQLTNKNINTQLKQYNNLSNTLFATPIKPVYSKTLSIEINLSNNILPLNIYTTTNYPNLKTIYIKNIKYAKQQFGYYNGIAPGAFEKLINDDLSVYFNDILISEFNNILSNNTAIINTSLSNYSINIFGFCNNTIIIAKDNITKIINQENNEQIVSLNNNTNLLQKYIVDDENNNLNTSKCLIFTDNTNTILQKIDTDNIDFNNWLKNPILPITLNEIYSNALDNNNLNKLTSLTIENILILNQNALCGCINCDLINIYNNKNNSKIVFNKNCFNLVGNSSKNNLSIILNNYNISTIRKQFINNIPNCKVGTQIYIRNDNKDVNREFPVFIVTENNNLYEIKDKHLNIIYSNNKLILQNVSTINEIHNVSIDLRNLNLKQIKANAFINETNIYIVYIPNNLELEANSLKNITTAPIRFLIDIDYNQDNIDIYKEWLGWTDSSTTKINKLISLVFNNGTLKYIKNKIVFKNINTTTNSNNNSITLFTTQTSNNSIFITDTSNQNRIVGVKSDMDTSLTDIIISSPLTSLGSNSLNTTNVIKRLNTGSIKTIEDYAFSQNTSISTVQLNNTITSIGNNAFTVSHVKEINIPSSLRDANGYGLNNEYELEKITYDSGVVGIQPSAMINCAAECSCIVIPNTVTYIGKYAFARLDQYALPYIRDISFRSAANNKLKTIDDFAFYNAILSTQDNALRFPNSLTSIGAAAFGYSIEAWTQTVKVLSIDPPINTLDANVEYIGPSAFIRHVFKDINLGQNKLKFLGEYAFAYPKNKYTLFIPETIESIGENAFKKNIILNPDTLNKNILSINVTIEKLSSVFNLTSVGGINYTDYTAYNWPGATNYTVFLATKSVKNNFILVYNNKLNFCPDGIDIDFINRAVIGSDKNITSAYIPEYINIISASAFKDCTKLTSIYSANDNIEFQASAFYNCAKLEQITTKNKNIIYLSSVEPYTFYRCESLTSIQLLSTATDIGEAAFNYCRSNSTYQLYYNSLDFKYYELSSIDNLAFANNDKLTAFYIASNITFIGDKCFDNCQKLKFIKFNIKVNDFVKLVDSTKTINQIIKAKFKGIRKDYKCEIQFTDAVYMNDGTIKIDSEFVNCYQINGVLSGISSVNYDQMILSNQTYLNLSNIVKVDPFVFRDTEILENINFHSNILSGLQEIGDFAFSNCSQLQTINGNILSCKYVGLYAFDNCSAIDTLEFNLDELQHGIAIGQGAFSNTQLRQLIFTTSKKGETYDDLVNIESIIKSKIGYKQIDNPNPLDLPEYCYIIVKNTNGELIGRYDYLFHDLLHSDVDINNNQLIFIDKHFDSIKPLLIIKAAGNNTIPALINNNFHVNIIGRWK